MKLWKVWKWVESRFLSQVINKLRPVLRDFWSCTKVALLLHLSVQGLALFSTDTCTPQLVVSKYDLIIQHFQDILWISIHIYSCLLYGNKLKKTLSFWALPKLRGTPRPKLIWTVWFHIGTIVTTRVTKTLSARQQCWPESFCKSGKFLQQAHYLLKNFRIFWKMSGYYTKYPDNMQSRDELEIFHMM